MDRNREARRASIVGSNGFNRRRHRTNSLRDSQDENGVPELQESVRLRERLKKDRDRERDLRERSSRSKRRRAAIAGDDTLDESVNDEEDEEIAAVRFSSPAAGSTSNHHHHGGSGHSSSFNQQHHILSSNNNHHLQHRKTFPPTSSSSTAKVARAPPVWKPGDEMISVAVPRKARSASTKRSHDWISGSNNSGNGDQNPAQPSSSPARHGHMPPAPTSPSSSMKKKLKHGTSNHLSPKLKPPKASSFLAKASSSNAEELEIEIAEVLYGLRTQSQDPPSSKKEESREINRFNGNGKSLNSILNKCNNSNLSPLSVTAPKRKRPRQVPEGPDFGFQSSPIANSEPEVPKADQTPKSEMSSPPKSERISGSATDNGVSEIGGISVISHAQPPVQESRATAEELKEGRDLIMDVKEDAGSSKEQEYPAARDWDRHFRDSPLIATASSAPTTINANLMVSEVENQKEVKFEIDLMAPPPDRETKFDTRAISVDQMPVLSTLDAPLPVVVSKDNVDEKGKSGSGNNRHSLNVATANGQVPVEGEPNNVVELTDSRNLDLRLDLEKPEREISSRFSVDENKSQLPAQKHQKPLKLGKEEQSLTEKPGHSKSSLPLTLPVASWPGGLPPMGYMAPLPGVVSVDGGGVTPLQPIFSQPRPKRCATHCHIARNIHCLHLFMKMSPFWPAPGGTPPVAASLFGSKPCANPSAVPLASDFNAVIRGDHSNVQDRKGHQNSAGIPNNVWKEKGSQPASSSDSAQGKHQILIQQPMPPVTPSNLLGPGFIFPINQQQVASARPSPGAKSPTTVAPCNAVSTSAAPSSTSSPAPMSFNYPNMSPNETQYLAILQNNAYPFPIPTVGPPPNYRGGPPAQSMPLFNGPFFSSQIIHQQLQHSQQQPSNPPPQMMQVQHNASAGQMMLVHHNANAGNNSSSSPKHIQTQQQQQRPQNSFSSQKAQPQPHNNKYMQGGGNDYNSPSSAADNQGSRATSVNIYGQNFALPFHPQNLLTPSNALAGANISNQAEKKSSSQSHQQQQGMKIEVESLPPHSFAMSFSPGIDDASMAQSHAKFQNCSEGVRQNIQMMAAATATQVVQKNSKFRISEDAKSGNSANIDNSSVKEDERKSFAFADAHTASSIQANNNAGPTRNSRPAMSNGSGAMNSVQNAQLQQQQQQQQQQQKQMLEFKHHQQQQQIAVNAINRTNKQPGTSNGSIYSEHLNSSSMMGGKFPNTISPVFPQNLVQRSSSPTPSPSQSPQWKNFTRTPVSSSQAGPSSLGSSIQTMHKNPPQQHSRNQPPMHAQISFGGNKKQLATPLQGQGPPPSGSQGPSSPMMVGSPTTSSLSKGTSGSPRTNSSASTSNNKTVGLHASPFTTQPSKNSPFILGNAKPQMQQQQSQQKNMQQSQLFFSNPYSQSLHLSSASPASTSTGVYYVPQRRPDQHQRPPPCTSTNDPATAIAAATSNAKGGGLQSGGMMVQASPLTLLPSGYSYVHPVPAGVLAKPAEQKQPAGNDNLHQWQPEKK